MSKVTVKIENAYEDGWESSHEVVLDAPTYDATDAEKMDVIAWFEDVVFQHTGDGHGADNDLGTHYLATIIASDDPKLIGEWYEWV